MASIGIGIGIEDLILQVLVLVLVLNFGNCQVLVLVLVLTLGSSEVLVLVLVSEKWYCPSLLYCTVYTHVTKLIQIQTAYSVSWLIDNFLFMGKVQKKHLL